MENFKNEEDEFLEELEQDYVCLHNVVRLFSGFSRPPTTHDFSKALEFLKYTIVKYNIICLGSQMEPINSTLDDFLAFLKEKWDSGQYDDIYLGVWFDTK
jgi:hypothetical protein